MDLFMKELLQKSKKVLVIKRNEYLLMEGDTNTDIYFIEEGSLRIYVMDGELEKNIRFGYRENFIVALDSFISQQPSSFYIQAIKKTIVHVITRCQFEEFLLESPNQLVNWTKIMEDLLLQQIEREVDLLTTSPKIRYQRVLKRSPLLFQEIPLRHIANYLRMTPETLSRLQKS
jgi:CRP/FNR family transcriptional regulator, anaerobic regulatory protein